MKQVIYTLTQPHSLSQIVVSLHDRGYTFDFAFAGPDDIICLQNGLCFPVANVALEEVSLTGGTPKLNDPLLCTVDTGSGHLGLIFKNTA